MSESCHVERDGRGSSPNEFYAVKAGHRSLKCIIVHELGLETGNACKGIFAKRTQLNPVKSVGCFLDVHVNRTIQITKTMAPTLGASQSHLQFRLAYLRQKNQNMPTVAKNRRGYSHSTPPAPFAAQAPKRSPRDRVVRGGRA